MKTTLLLATVCFQLVIAPISGAAPTRKILKVMNSSWPPFFNAKGSEAYPGYGLELTKRCLNKSGYEASFDFYPINRMFDYHFKGKLDVAVMSFKESRAKKLLYSKEPLFINTYVGFVRADSKFKYAKLSDLDALTIGHLSGLKTSDEYRHYIEKRLSKAKDSRVEIVSADNDNIRKLAAGRIDYFVGSRATIFWKASQINLADRIKEFPHKFKEASYYLTISKKSNNIADRAKLIKDFDQCVTREKKSGWYKKTRNRYGSP